MLQGIAMFWGIALATYYGSHICVDVAVGAPAANRAGAASTCWPPH
jgi:hypothetical protein